MKELKEGLQNKDNPPYTHNLNYLADQSGVNAKMTEEQKDFIDLLEPLNIEARIEPVLLEESNDKSGFLEEILKTGEIIYSAEPTP